MFFILKFHSSAYTMNMKLFHIIVGGYSICSKVFFYIEIIFILIYTHEKYPLRRKGP